MDLQEYDKMYHLEETNWWYTGRRDLVLKIVAQIDKESLKPLKILDAGCGTGINLKHLQNHSDSYGIDISKEALRYSGNRGLHSLICCSADRLPFSDEIFDLVLALDVIEHIDKDLAAVNEFYRVLKHGGRLIITVPAFQFLWSEHDQVVHHKRRYTRSSVLNILQLGGFENEKATYWNIVLFLPVAVMRLLKRFRASIGISKQTDLIEIPSFLNKILICILIIENRILDKFNLPFGVSVMCLCRKV